MKKRQRIYLNIVCLVLLFLTGCNKKQLSESSETLVICTDYFSSNAVEMMINQWKQLGNDIETKLIYIPKNEASAEIVITETRTELMSGEGPDVFIFQSDAPYMMENYKMLFQNPEKAMYSDIFLPLDSYIEKAEYINTDCWNQVVLQAGQTAEGQLLLPLMYDFYGTIFPKNENLEKKDFVDFWEKGMDAGNEIITQAVRGQIGVSFYNRFAQLADYEKESLVISKEDLLKEVESAIAFEKKAWEIESDNSDLRALRVMQSFLLQLAQNNKDAHALYAFPNIDGGVTAHVSVYAGINRNTQMPEEAFSFLDYVCGKSNIVDVYPSQGISINQDVVRKQCDFLHILDEDIETFLDMCETVTDARFYTAWDRNIVEMYKECEKIQDEQERAQVVDKLYDIMRMQLNE